MARRTPKKPKKLATSPKAAAEAASRSSELERKLTLFISTSGAYRLVARARDLIGAEWTRYDEVRVIGASFEQRIHPADVHKLPPFALAGDCSRQRYCLGGPRVLHVDVTRTCRVCGQAFVFSAREQKHWYETLQFWTDSEAVDCPACRRSNRARRAVQRRHEVAVAAVAATPRDAAAQLELAVSIVALVEATGGGDVAAGIAAARASRRHAASANPEALYWEGRLQQLAGRDARPALTRFIEEALASRRRGLAARVADARERLERESAAEGVTGVAIA